MTTVVWFQRDLRLADHPALQAALQRPGAVIPVFIDDAAAAGRWREGAAARVWLHHSLDALDRALRRRGSRLVLRSGDTLKELLTLCRICGADAVYWTRRYEPAARRLEARIARRLRSAGILAESRDGSLLVEPDRIATQEGQPYRVFTAYWRRALPALHPALPLPTAHHLPAPKRWPAGLRLNRLGLLPAVRWDVPMMRHWSAGEDAAIDALHHFTQTLLPRYRDARDRPAIDGTSALSPFLRVGAISPRQVWHAVGAAEERRGVRAGEWRGGKFTTELLWRDFSHHLLWHFPASPDQPMRAEFKGFPWRRSPKALRAWQRGRTGIPLVDAGMRQLWATGWMHNRVRMVAASFLMKNLGQAWQTGARWFWDTLIDADLANNTLGWQWVGGSGADAAPYFRIFNPVTQSERFDPQGAYIRRWVPELAALQSPAIHSPWLASTQELRAAGLELGRDYPRPIVDLKASRAAALAAFATMRRRAGAGARQRFAPRLP